MKSGKSSHPSKEVLTGIIHLEACGGQKGDIINAESKAKIKK